jgi:rhomboid protease GluP
MPADLETRIETWAVIAAALDDARCAELALVLTARGFPHRRIAATDGWRLLVPDEVAERAHGELAAYRAENSRPSGARRVELVGTGTIGVVAYVAILCVIFVSIRRSFFGLDWYGAGQLDAGRVVFGELWRTLTALTMHIDLAHLLGNLAFGSFFGYFVGRYLGAGFGWLAVLTSAVLGNLLNALVEPPEHRAIGASTAVFAALGLLTAYTWRRGFFKETPWRARIAPVIAGIGLLAFTGTGGENTDLTAHLMGFIAGVAAGLCIARWMTVELLRERALQRSSAAVTGLAVIVAWLWALYAAG